MVTFVVVVSFIIARRQINHYAPFFLGHPVHFSIQTHSPNLVLCCLVAVSVVSNSPKWALYEGGDQMQVG